jgi:hypothetical protein
VYEDEEDSEDEPIRLELVLVQQALALQSSLLEVFQAPPFQADVHAILREQGGPEASSRLCTGREALCEEALRKTLPRHGFANGPQGLQEALHMLEKVAMESEEVLDGLLAVYDCLGLAPPAALLSSSGTALPCAPWSS